jgi:hypothetical protein
MEGEGLSASQICGLMERADRGGEEENVEDDEWCIVAEGSLRRIFEVNCSFSF